MQRSILGLVLCVALALSGCATKRPQPELFETSFHEPYVLASGDRLRVIVFGQESLSNSYAVDGAGRVSMPLIGLVEARGHTTADLERQIEGRLRNGFLREPKVSVEVEQFRPFFILGEVQNSGQYPFVNGMTFQTAIAIAGGFAPRAYRYTVDVTRMVRGQPVTGTVDITEPARPGDTIVVRERFF